MLVYFDDIIKLHSANRATFTSWCAFYTSKVMTTRNESCISITFIAYFTHIWTVSEIIIVYLSIILCNRGTIENWRRNLLDLLYILILLVNSTYFNYNKVYTYFKFKSYFNFILDLYQQSFSYFFLLHSAYFSKDC